MEAEYSGQRGQDERCLRGVSEQTGKPGVTGVELGQDGGRGPRREGTGWDSMLGDEWLISDFYRSKKKAK